MSAPPRRFPGRLDGQPVTAVVTADGLDVDGRLLTWLEMDEVIEGDHRVRMELADRPSVELTHLGSGFDGFVADMRAARGPVRRSAMVEASGAPIDTYLSRDPAGPLDVHLYPTGLVVEPRIGAPTFVPLPLIERVDRDGYTLALRLRGLDDVVLQAFGARTDELVADLDRARLDLQAATMAGYASFDEALTGFGAPDGWATSREGAGRRWPALRAAARGGSRAAEVELLAGLAGEQLRVGVYTAGGSSALPFVLAPVAGRVAVEATDVDDRATFVFTTDDVDWLNAALLVVNFRREVLSFDETELGRWAVAVRMLSVVRDLRVALAGRVVHDARWAEAVRALLPAGPPRPASPSPRDERAGPIRSAP